MPRGVGKGSRFSCSYCGRELKRGPCSHCGGPVRKFMAAPEREPIDWRRIIMEKEGGSHAKDR